MSYHTEILDRGDIREEIKEYLMYNPQDFETIFDIYLSWKYGINTKKLGKIIRENIPEEVL